jgi:uncharacterized SAM-binding protein YcdF (DUF218 family)
MYYFIFGVPICLLIIFLIMYWIKPYRLINGIVFDCFLGSFLIALMFFLGNNRNIIFNILLCIIIFAVAVILFFGIYIFVGYLLINSIKMAKKERISLANSLSLLLVIAVAAELIIAVFFTKYVRNQMLLALFSFVISIEVYLFISAVSYITMAILVLFRPYKPHQDYFIVLGCGLLGGDRVSPLLAGRVDKAIAAYNKQKQKGQTSKIIFSGGKGSDEKISEAEAMQVYAVEHGVILDDTLIENKSVNTLENMMFSKKIMEDISGDNYSCTYVTSSYHVFRAGIYAYRAGIRKAKGLGSKTKGYYVPNAMIREYIALFVMNKKYNIIAAGLIFMMYAGLWIIYVLGR